MKVNNRISLKFDDWVEYIEKYLALTLDDIKNFNSPQKLVFLSDVLRPVEFFPSEKYWSEGNIRNLKTDEYSNFKFDVQLDDLWFSTNKGRTVLGANTDISLILPYLNLDLNTLNARVGYKEGYCVRYEDVNKIPILLS
jgi:hypothetical protein